MYCLSRLLNSILRLLQVFSWHQEMVSEGPLTVFVDTCEWSLENTRSFVDFDQWNKRTTARFKSPRRDCWKVPSETAGA